MSSERGWTESRDILLPGDIILSRGRGFFDCLNRFLQATARRAFRPSPFSHAAICTGPDSVIDADIFCRLGSKSFDKWLSDVSYKDAVVFRRPARVRADDLCGAAQNEEQRGVLGLPTGSNESGSEIVRWAYYFTGRKYNWFFLRGKPTTASRKTFFCSEFVASVIARVQPEAITRPPEKLLPIDLPQLLRNAGWEERKLADLFVSARASPSVDLRPIAEMSPVVRDFFEANSDLAAMYESFRTRLDHQMEVSQMLAKQSALMASSELDRLSLVVTTKEFTDLSLQWLFLFGTELAKARSPSEAREKFLTVGLQIDMQAALDLMDWFVSSMANNSAGDPVHEILDDAIAQGRSNFLLGAMICDVRLALLDEDIDDISKRFKAVLEQAAAIGRSPEKLESLKRELLLLFDRYPYIAAIDAEFEGVFYERLERCIATFNEAAATKVLPETQIKAAAKLVAKLISVRKLFSTTRVISHLMGKMKLQSADSISEP